MVGEAREVAVRLRPADATDCERIWLWRNDPETRAASFSTAPIPRDVHARWFEDALRRTDRRVFVIEVDQMPAGTARLDLAARDADVSIHLAREWRGRGVGSSALRALADLAFGQLGIDRLIASVKPDNQASLTAFARAGFAMVEAGAIVRLERRRPR